MTATLTATSSRSSPEKLSDALRGVSLEIRYYVAVSVSSDSDVTVAEYFHYNSQSDTLNQHKRCSSVPEVMELLSGKTGSREDLLEAMCNDGTREWLAGHRREDQVPLISLPAQPCS